RDLKGAHEAALRDHVGARAGDVGAVEHDAAGVGWHEAAHAVEQRGFAGAVRPDQPGDAGGLDRERDAAQRRDAVEAAGHGANIEQGHRRTISQSSARPLATRAPLLPAESRAFPEDSMHLRRSSPERTRGAPWRRSLVGLVLAAAALTLAAASDAAPRRGGGYHGPGAAMGYRGPGARGPGFGGMHRLGGARTPGLAGPPGVRGPRA